MGSRRTLLRKKKARGRLSPAESDRLARVVRIIEPDVPADLVAMRIEVPDDVPGEAVDIDDLPRDWNELPDHPACLARGDAWAAAARTLLLRVPSAMVPEEHSILLNPRHPDAARIAVIAVRPFDGRLLKR